MIGNLNSEICLGSETRLNDASQYFTGYVPTRGEPYSGPLPTIFISGPGDTGPGDAGPEIPVLDVPCEGQELR